MLLATSTGLWVGSDSEHFHHEAHRGLAFCPLYPLRIGVTDLPASEAGGWSSRAETLRLKGLSPWVADGRTVTRGLEIAARRGPETPRKTRTVGVLTACAAGLAARCDSGTGRHGIDLARSHRQRRPRAEHTAAGAVDWHRPPPRQHSGAVERSRLRRWAVATASYGTALEQTCRTCSPSVTRHTSWTAASTPARTVRCSPSTPATTPCTSAAASSPSTAG